MRTYHPCGDGKWEVHGRDRGVKGEHMRSNSDGGSSDRNRGCGDGTSQGAKGGERGLDR